ncbi:MAG: sulfatase-like hydrolase/transferase, partial [Bacteroidota bacterium]
DDIGIISTPPYTGPTDDGTAWSLQPDSLIDPSSAVPYNMPNLMSFASGAKQMNYMYATPSCAPSRAQLLTGRYPFSNGIVFPAFPSDSAASSQYPGSGYLADSILTYANYLQDLGYYTGFGGKYNLRYGIADIQAQSQGEDAYNDMVQQQMLHLNQHGFDTTFGPAHFQTVSQGDSIYKGGLALIGNTVDYHPAFADSMFFPYLLQDWALQFIETQQETEKPYYLHYCFGLIHDSDPEAFAGMTDSEEFAAKIELADSIIGTLLSMVENDSNTVVIIAGDNGTETFTSNFGPGYATVHQGDTIPGGKLTYQSRGSRVPFLIRWPGQLDNQPYNELVDFADVFGTIYEIAGGSGSLPPLDGQSFLHAISDGKLGTPQPVRQAVYSQMQREGFVADKKYLYLVEDVYNDTTGSWYDIQSSPQIDVPISASDVPVDEQQKLEAFFETLGTRGMAEN